MSTMIALFLVLSTLVGCAGETLMNVKNAIPPPDPVSFTVELETYGDSLRDDGGRVIASWEYEIPVLSAQGEEDACAAFNAAFDPWRDGPEHLTTAARDDRPASPYTDELHCAVYQTGRLVSVAGTYVTYTGGAHPNTTLLSWNFDLESGAFFDAAMLDDDPGFHAAVVRALKRRAIERAGESGLGPREFFWQDYEDTLENWSSYAVSFDEEGMTVGFSPYELAAYAAGPQTFTIPYSELAEHLGAQGRALLGLDAEAE